MGARRIKEKEASYRKPSDLSPCTKEQNKGGAQWVSVVVGSGDRMEKGSCKSLQKGSRQWVGLIYEQLQNERGGVLNDSRFPGLDGGEECGSINQEF